MITQEKNINIVKLLEAVETTKSNYERLLTKLKKGPAYIFKLPNLKLVVDAATESQKDESDENSGTAMYQNQKLLYYSREQRFLNDHAIQIFESIIECFRERHGNLFDDDKIYEANVNSDEGNCVLFDVACLLNCNAWVSPAGDLTMDEPFEEALSKMHKRYTVMTLFAGIMECWNFYLFRPLY